jgi:hypothetical protein
MMEKTCCNTNTVDTCCLPPDSWVCGRINTSAGDVYQVSTTWAWPEFWGQAKSRISAFRMKYIVDPGLYAVGNPDPDSDLFVTANYKLSFDILRRELNGLNAWILVLDTKGINVWCAAGKGTFGTEELVRRIQEVKLDQIINHKRIVVPQLGAVGVSAHRVKQATGFRVHFGPVSAGDIPAYLNSRYRAASEMRKIKFGFVDRLVLTPMEILPMMKKFPLFALIVLVLFGLQPSGILWKEAWLGGAPFLLLGFVTILAGAFLTPLLLPIIPSRAFGIKGWIVGIIFVALSLQVTPLYGSLSKMLVVFSYLFFPAASSYIALQFTGSTPYTGKHGVEEELKIAVPLYMTSMVLSLSLIILYKLKVWGIV